MSLEGAVIKDGATALVPTGGSDITWNSTGVPINNGAQFQVTADTDFRTRRLMNVKNRPATYTNGSYTKAKRECVVIQPEVIDGVTHFNLLRITSEVHPLTPAARELNLRMLGGQAIADADLSAFWTTGSIK